jgi:hypothetical protein
MVGSRALMSSSCCGLLFAGKSIEHAHRPQYVGLVALNDFAIHHHLVEDKVSALCVNCGV